MTVSAEDDLELLLGAAAQAGRIAKQYFRREPQVWFKAGNSPVSEADYAVDAFLKEALLAARPDYGWLSEESDGPDAGPEAPERFFVVDPIDGTRAFLRGEDTWCVSLAVVEAGRPVAGVIEAPIREEVFRAAAGGGAWLNDRVVRVSDADANEVLCVALPDAMRKKLADDVRASLRVLFSAPSLAYRLAQVAAGRLDGTLIRASASDWDIAAGDLILAEAGGLLGDVAGEERLYNIRGRRHGLLIAGARHAWPRLQSIARTTTAA